jgi:hypothetical protein
MRETWYILEDGSAGDPREIAPGKDGKLVHKDGRKVAYAPHGPRSRGVDLDPDGKPTQDKAPTKAKEAKEYETREMTAEKPKRGYKTRKG